MDAPVEVLELVVCSMVDTTVVASVSHRHCIQHGFSKRFATETAIVVQELASNMVKHGGGRGELTLRIHPDHVAIVARDHGPGLSDLAAFVRDGFSRGRQVIPQTMHGGLGVGGGAVTRLTDGFEVEHPADGGLRIAVVKRAKPRP